MRRTLFALPLSIKLGILLVVFGLAVVADRFSGTEEAWGESLRSGLIIIGPVIVVAAVVMWWQDRKG